MKEKVSILPPSEAQWQENQENGDRFDPDHINMDENGRKRGQIYFLTLKMKMGTEKGTENRKWTENGDKKTENGDRFIFYFENVENGDRFIFLKMGTIF